MKGFLKNKINKGSPTEKLQVGTDLETSDFDEMNKKD